MLHACFLEDSVSSARWPMSLARSCALVAVAIVQPSAALVPAAAATRCLTSRVAARSTPVLALAERPLTPSRAGGLVHNLGAILAAVLISLPPSPLVAPALAQPPPMMVRAASAADEPSAMLPATDTDAPPATDATAPPATDAAAKKPTPSRKYINLTGFPFPLGPFTERKTVMTELVPGRVYGFEQEQSLSGITANVRSTVFRMRDNHLLVYNPLAPTEEYLRQIDGLNHYGVSHILLGATPVSRSQPLWTLAPCEP